MRGRKIIIYFKQQYDIMIVYNNNNIKQHICFYDFEEAYKRGSFVRSFVFIGAMELL